MDGPNIINSLPPGETTSMARSLRLLIVEDSEDDCTLIVRSLQRGGYKPEYERVDTMEALTAALGSSVFDLVICDHNLPGFNSLTAMQLIKRQGHDTPFIIVSRSIGEELAVEAMKAGAADYVLTNNLARLVPAVERELADVEERSRRKRAEESLEESEARFRRLAENAQDLIYRYRLKPTRGFEYVSPAATAITGYTPEEHYADPDLGFKIVHPDDRGLLQSALTLQVASPAPLSLRWRRKDGKVIWTEQRNVPIRDNTGEIIAIEGIARDITQRKEAEEALRKGEERYRTIVENSGGMIYNIRLEDDQQSGTLEFLSNQVESLLGYKPEEFMRDRTLWSRIVHEEDFPRLAEQSTQLLEGKKPVTRTYRVRHKHTGEYRWIEDHSSPRLDEQGNVIGRTGVGRDVTERYAAEQQIQLLAHAIQSTTEFISITDLDNRFTFVNRAFLEAYGYSESEVLGKTPDFVQGSGVSLDSVMERQQQTMAGGWRGGVMNRRKDGSEFPIFLSTSPIKDREGRVIGLMGVAQDISAQMRAEEELRRSEEKYRALFEDSKDVVYISTPNGELLDINQAGIELFGYASRDEALWTNIARDLSFDPAEQERLQKVLAGQGFVKDFELSLRRRDGAPLNVLLTATAVRDETGEIAAIRGILRDITERKRFEEQIRQTQKLESIGTLAGGIAHDFNNILGIILGHITLLEHAKDKPDMFAASTAILTQAVHRGANLVRQILTFARKTDVVLEPVQVNTVIQELAQMMEETFPKTIDIVLQLGKDVPIITMSHTHLHQALLNLCVNARDAMADPSVSSSKSKRLTIKTRVAAADEVRGTFPDAISGDYVSISVSDTGTGMDEQTKKRIFEPFFTTKELGRGTGLGLAVLYGVVQSHNGFVDVKSSVGEGTTFILYFPLPAGSVVGAGELEIEQEKILGGTETLLVVEDEDSLRELMTSVLGENGYTVLSARDGMEAIETYMRNKERIQLVLTDMGLPKLDGAAVIIALKNINPNVRIIMASGYLEPNLKSELFKQGAREFVQKPYSPRNVLHKIREALDQQ